MSCAAVRQVPPYGPLSAHTAASWAGASRCHATRIPRAKVFPADLILPKYLLPKSWQTPFARFHTTHLPKKRKDLSRARYAAGTVCGCVVVRLYVATRVPWKRIS